MKRVIDKMLAENTVNSAIISLTKIINYPYVSDYYKKAIRKIDPSHVVDNITTIFLVDALSIFGYAKRHYDQLREQKTPSNTSHSFDYEIIEWRKIINLISGTKTPNGKNSLDFLVEYNSLKKENYPIFVLPIHKVVNIQMTFMRELKRLISERESSTSNNLCPICQDGTSLWVNGPCAHCKSNLLKEISSKWKCVEITPNETLGIYEKIAKKIGTDLRYLRISSTKDQTKALNIVKIFVPLLQYPAFISFLTKVRNKTWQYGQVWPEGTTDEIISAAYIF